MEPSMVIVLSSSPPPMAISQDAYESNGTAKKMGSRNGLSTPTKYHKDIWKMPSSSPLPSPGALLRGLLQPKARRVSQNKVGKSFKTARELLETEELRGELLFAVDDSQQAEKYAAIVPEEITTQPKSVGVKKRVPKKTIAKSEKRVNRTETVSSHFSKKSKISSAGKGSKSLSPVDQNKTVSSHADVLQSTQARSKDAKAGLDEVPMPLVPARRRDWTPVKNTVPVVEIISSPMVRRTEYEANLGEAEPEDLTTGTTDESTSSKQSFGDKIGLFKFDSNSTSAPSTGANSGLARSLSSTLGTTRRCIQILEKPHLSRSISYLSSSAKDSRKKGRKKAETITDLATAQYRTEKEEKPQPPSIVDFLTKWSPEVTVNDTKPSAKKQKRNTKYEATAEGKKVTNRRGGKKAMKEKVDEPIELLSPQSAIRRTNEQQIIFGTFSQLTDGTVDTIPDIEASGTHKLSSYFDHRISSDSQFSGLAKARSPQMYNNTLGEGAEALEEFLHREFDVSEATKAKSALKRKGLWEAASRNDELAGIDSVNLSKTSNVDNEEFEMLEMSLPVEQKPRRGNGQGSKSGPVTPEFEDYVKKSATPSMKKRKRDPWKLSTEDSKSIPLADGSDAEAPDIVPGKDKKSSKKATTGSPQSKETTKGKRAISPAESKGKRRAKSPLSSPTRKRHRSRSPSRRPATPFLCGHKANKVIHSYISKAITAEYRSTNDIVNSWHYKILTYEPIILEDFTAWLNTVGFGNVGMDDEVPPSIVKEWAEARSVVNVWRETQNGTDRKRF
ncbi:hypothetical protein EV426DRAFT_612592 [Tirmania nivea]|nr:hypothetical protein EV426DRAFT_612592 [Tirmania nivea]